jgi:uncharacterized protein (DUF1697 family)
MMGGMASYVAFLRGINVGGHKLVAMSDLRELLGLLGYTGVSTYLQSGNAVFSAPRGKDDRLAAEIEEQMSTRLHLDVRVLVRTGDELARVVAANPLPQAANQPAQLHVAFLGANPEVDALPALGPSRFPDEDIRLGDGVLYVWYRNGLGRSKLTHDLLERRLGVSVTLRNWNTVTKLLSLV